MAEYTDLCMKSAS